MNDNDPKPVELLAVDVETTGLDPGRDRILEIAMRTLDARLEETDRLHLVIRWNGEPSDRIRRMHGANGLLAACASPDASDPGRAAARAAAFTARHAAGHRLLPFGSTVGFDRRMLDAFDPTILAPCTHRSLDLSSLMEAVRLWIPDMEPDCERTTDHRASHCLDDTIRQGRAYRRLLASCAA